MTTARHAVPQPGTRQRRRRDRRRLFREELLAVLILVVALLVTVILLGLQWLDGGASINALRTLHPGIPILSPASGGPL